MPTGYNGMWYDTYREGDDPSMQVLTIDNVLCTKNMRITDIQRVERNCPIMICSMLNLNC